MKTVTVEGLLRSELGKKSTRQLRSEGNVPGVIYGGTHNVHFSASQKALKPVVYTPDFLQVQIIVDGKTYNCILKDLQFDKLTDEVIHIDFLELVNTKRVRATVPLKFTGQSKGVKEGGRFISKMNAIKLRTMPQNLKEYIEVDITNLEIGKNLRIEDIKITDTEILHHPRIPIASVVTTRALKQEEAAGAKDAAKK